MAFWTGLAAGIVAASSAIVLAGVNAVSLGSEHSRAPGCTPQFAPLTTGSYSGASRVPFWSKTETGAWGGQAWFGWTALSAQRSQPEPQNRAGLGGMRLLPGYAHEYQGGLDTCTGRIWKKGGATILYDIGNLAGDKARALAERSGVAWTKTQQIGGTSFQVTMLTSRYVVVTVGHVANFSILKATDEMLADLLLMLVTYDSEKHMMQGCF